MHFKKTDTTKLTNRELEIMQILWDSDAPLVASEIAKRGEKLTINTTQAVLKKLLNLQYIKVADIVYSGTVLSRSYTTTLTADEFEVSKMVSSYHKISDKTSGLSHFVNTLLAEEKDKEALRLEIEQIEAMLKEKRKSLGL